MAKDVNRKEKVGKSKLPKKRVTVSKEDFDAILGKLIQTKPIPRKSK